MSLGSVYWRGKESAGSFLTWWTKGRTYYKLVTVITILAILISPISPVRPEPAHAIALEAAAAIMAGACGIGMASSMVIWAFTEGLDTAEGNPLFLRKLGFGCATGAITVWIAIPGVHGWLAEALHLAADAAVSEIAEAMYEQWLEEPIGIIIDNWQVAVALLDPQQRTVFLMHAMLVEESEESQQLDELWYDILELYENDTGSGVEIEIVPVVDLSVIEPDGGRLYQLSSVAAEITSPDEIETCTDADAETTSNILYVQFGYALTPSPEAVIPLTSSNSTDGRDWYGCNGWALDFDIRAAGIDSPTPIYLAARASDLYGNQTDWSFSGQIIADPRFEHDYSVTDVQFTPSAPNVGESVLVEATVTNAGASDEASISVSLYEDGQYRNSHYIESLIAGESATANFNWTAVEGAHTLRIQAELDEDAEPSNDSASGLIVVGTAPLLWVNGSSYPSALQISSSTAGTSGTFGVTLQNAGSAATSVSVSKAGTQASWISLASTSLSLEPNTTHNYQFSATVPSGQPAGTYQAELRFDWTGGSTVVLPIQFNVGSYDSGHVVHTFSPSSGTVNGAWQSTLIRGWHTYVTLDNYTSTADDFYIEDSFTLTESEYYRIEANSSNEWSVDVTEIESESLSTGTLFRLGGFETTRTSSFTDDFDIHDELIIGQNNWRIALTNMQTYGNNTEWRINETRFILSLTEAAWWASYNPGDSTVATWKAGWDYANVCATVDSVSSAGDVVLYNNGQLVRTKYLDSSDVGDEVCWAVTSSRVSGTNNFNLKANTNEANVALSNIYFEVHYFSGEPVIQAVRNLTLLKADVDQNVTANLTFSNVGSNIAENGQYNDSLPTGLQLVSGSLGGDLPDIDPGSSASASYVFKGVDPGSYGIPGLMVTYEDPSGYYYLTTLNVSVIEVWGGTLQPDLGTLPETESGSPAILTATVSSSLNPAPIEDATVIAQITRPDASVVEVSLLWDEAQNCYQAEYIPTQVGAHQVTLSASRLFYAAGSSSPEEWVVGLPNQAPTAQISYVQGGSDTPLTLTLDGGGSIDVDGIITDYDWDIGDDGTVEASGRVITWTFATIGTYEITLDVTDNAGESDSETVEVAVANGQMTREIPLMTGWNLISMPLVTQPAYTAELLCDEINAKGGSVLEIYQWSAGGWDSHLCDLPFNDFDIELGAGYFVRATSSSTWTVTGEQLTGQLILALATGWTLISIPSGVSFLAEELGDAINGQGGTCTEIYRWHTGGWDSHLIDLPFNDFPIEAGAGYFVRCNSASTFTVTMP